MASPNEIGALQQIMVKPQAWELHCSSGVYWLRFTYLDPRKGEWADVVTRRGGRKEYKTADAALSDVRKVADVACVYHMWAD